MLWGFLGGQAALLRAWLSSQHGSCTHWAEPRPCTQPPPAAYHSTRPPGRCKSVCEYLCPGIQNHNPGHQPHKPNRPVAGSPGPPDLWLETSHRGRGQGARRVGIGTAPAQPAEPVARTLAVAAHTRLLLRVVRLVAVTMVTLTQTSCPHPRALGSREESRGGGGRLRGMGPEWNCLAEGLGLGGHSEVVWGRRLRVRRSLLGGHVGGLGLHRRVLWGQLTGRGGGGVGGGGGLWLARGVTGLRRLGHWVWRRAGGGRRGGRPLHPPRLSARPRSVRSSLLEHIRAAEPQPEGRAGGGRRGRARTRRMRRRRPDRPSAWESGAPAAVPRRRRAGDWAAACVVSAAAAGSAQSRGASGGVGLRAAWLERLTGPNRVASQDLRRVRVAARFKAQSTHITSTCGAYLTGEKWRLAERLLHSQGAEDREVLDLERSLEEGTRDRETRHGPEAFPGGGQRLGDTGDPTHWAKKRTQVTKMDVAPAPRHTRSWDAALCEPKAFQAAVRGPDSD
ncbi:hypothetical protein Cadr_000021628 [Camelus dromedarius]|uniref:Uncharacterized protein n=1 Tax=Camelus dromedarius TaxID=9838 RepID=A0A5N4CT37_CAMDR|nr:hypothetical protein Cadr_000021628 [Camelus dromedarius]